MPTLRLAEPAAPPFPAHLHAAACGLLEAPDADHTAQRKPFAVGAPVVEQGAEAAFKGSASVLNRRSAGTFHRF